MDSTNFTPPVRRSMTDQEIQDALGNATADEAGITAAMELLETQAQLRDIEKMEFSSWVIEMERIGSPEAKLAVENAHRAQKGLEPLTALAAEAPTVAPIEDVVSHLNNLYAAQAAQSATDSEFEVESQDFTEVGFEQSHHHEDIATEPQQDISTEPEESGDTEFDRLLAADTVVGAEDELTALEEELESSAAPVASFESLTIVENDPGVDFVQPSAIEEVSLESVPKLSRRSRASSQFWAWLGLSGSVLPLGLAWYVSKSGLAYSQAVIAVFLGLLASALVVSVGALAGKRSGLPTLMLSRAPFGVFGNAAPASVLTLVRLFWSAAIVTGAISLGQDFLKVESVTDFGDSATIYLTAFVLLLVGGAITLAIFGGRVLFRAQQAVGIIGSLVAIALIALTANSFSLQQLLAQPSTEWLPAFGVSVLTFSVFGLAWTSAGADFARKLSTKTRGASVVGWGFLALVLVPTLVAAYGLALIGSLGKPELSMFSDFEAILNPQAPWFGYLLIGSGALSLVVVLAMSMYSSNLGLHSIGARLKPGLAQPIIGALVLSTAIAAVYFFSNTWTVMADYAKFVAVPVAAWAGIFISDILIRRIAYHEISLSRSYGFYKPVNVVNLTGWVLATAAGFGLIYIEQSGLNWTGYLADLLVNQEFWITSSFGIVITFAFAALLPVIFGIPRIKRQEQEVLAIEARRDDLKDIFGLVD